LLVAAGLLLLKMVQVALVPGMGMTRKLALVTCLSSRRHNFLARLGCQAMQSLIPLCPLGLANPGNSGARERVSGQISASPRAPTKVCITLGLALCLWNLPNGPTEAAEFAAPAQAARSTEPSADSNTTPAPVEGGAPEAWNLYGQATFVKQYHPSFTSPYQGANSLSPVSNGEETADVTLFLGVRLWDGGALYVNAEIDQGFGFDDTLGLAGFSSGEAYKVGKAKPYFRLPRAFLRQRFDLGGEAATLSPGPNELGGTQTADNVVLTIGKFSVVDIFDSNRYAHDPRADFLNWSIIDAAAFDYAADAWGYTVGIAAEWTQSWWTLRGGFFDLSDIPNSTRLEPGFNEFALIGEFEGRYDLNGHPGKLKVLGFLNNGRMGSYSDAVQLGLETNAIPSTALVRHSASRPGIELNLEQEVTPDLGAFARISFNNGSKEAYDFTDVNRSASAGISVKGTGWNRADDVFGLAAAVNGLSGAARTYFAAGGLGILIGDGQLPHYRTEDIVETYYSMRVVEHFTLSVDYQYVANPAYNHDRGPVSIFSLRVHADF
jgi:high affinity Mn2+ porin